MRKNKVQRGNMLGLASDSTVHVHCNCLDSFLQKSVAWISVLWKYRENIFTLIGIEQCRLQWLIHQHFFQLQNHKIYHDTTFTTSNFIRRLLPSRTETHSIRAIHCTFNVTCSKVGCSMRQAKKISSYWISRKQ